MLWQSFIARFGELAPKVNRLKVNVFYELESPVRTKKLLVEMARGTRPFISSDLWALLEKFMEFMRKLPGVEGENYRTVYDGMSPAGLVKRLLTKRPIVFLYDNDTHVLRNETALKERYGGNKWYNVTVTLNALPDRPCLQEYISYDEMLMSACVSMSTPTFYVSDGSLRDPAAKPTREFIPEGILCGLVGARLEKGGFMEHRFVFPRKSGDRTFDDVHHSDAFWISNVYPQAFPEGKIPTKAEVDASPELYANVYKDGVNVVYLKRRLSFSVIPFIREAESRGIESQVADNR